MSGNIFVTLCTYLKLYLNLYIIWHKNIVYIFIEDINEILLFLVSKILFIIDRFYFHAFLLYFFTFDTKNFVNRNVKNISHVCIKILYIDLYIYIYIYIYI